MPISDRSARWPSGDQIEYVFHVRAPIDVRNSGDVALRFADALQRAADGILGELLEEERQTSLYKLLGEKVPTATCPYCGAEVVNDPFAESEHMNLRHPDVVERRLRDAGLHQEADRFLARPRVTVVALIPLSRD